MLFGMTCPHKYSVAEALAHVGLLLVASAPPPTYAISVFLIRNRWRYVAYAVVLLALNIVVMLVLLPFTL